MAKCRDCKTCVHRVPVWDENEGIWKTAECVKWDCEYINRKEAVEAWKKLHGGSEG